MKHSTENKEKISDKVSNALERVVNHAIEDGEANAYLCTLQLPKQFSSDQHQANFVYKKFISDFGKAVMRKTGETPRYVTVKTDNGDNPEYSVCLFTRSDCRLPQPEEFAEKGRAIANGKVGQTGWGMGKLDIIDLLNDAPRFSISQSIPISPENREEVIAQLQDHLQGQSKESQSHQRTLFVSKCPE